MSRPFPILPRGPRRLRPPSPRLLFACPKLRPDWEFSALRALMKPKAAADDFRHREALQPWPADADAVLHEVTDHVAQRTGFRPSIRLHPEGDYHFVADVDPTQLEEAKTFAAVLSSRLPSLWFVLGRLYLRGGRFHRRERGRRLHLVPAPDVHLPRPLRNAVRDLF